LNVSGKRKIIEKALLELKRRLDKNPQDPDLKHGLKGISLPKGYQVFKHKEENQQVRILYKADEYKDYYGAANYIVYVASIAIGNEVHNAGGNSEYVENFAKFAEKEPKCEKFYKISKEV